jgi:8-oxo-dGTP pyrophosphatase MutT (NUDIX family)
MVSGRTTPTGLASPRLEQVRAALRETLEGDVEETVGRVAAVAAVLREHGGEVEMLFIRRAQRAGDPWSGHMAWPGGKREPCDGTTLDCAIRETREEVGLDLSGSGELIGRLREWRHGGGASPRGLRAVVPYVFALRCEPPLAPGPEVQEVVWVPLSYFFGWTTRRPWSLVAPALPEIPLAFRYDGRLIWGLTLWMLGDLLRRLRRA